MITSLPKQNQAPVSAAEAVEAFLAAPALTPELALLVAQTFQALADPTRARLLYALTRGERSVNEIAAIAGVSPSATSHQLKHLRDLRIVKFRRVGTHIHYSVDDSHVAGLFREALHHMAHVVYGLPDHLDGGKSVPQHTVSMVPNE